MKEDNVAAFAGIGPDLFLPPHVLPLLMELLAGDKQEEIFQQEQVVSHLVKCHYCRTAIIFLLGIVQEYDRRNNNSEDAARDLFVNFASISHEIEASEARGYERLGAYAEAIVYEGQNKANLRFPDVKAHLKICADCSSIVEMTVSSLNESDEH